MRKTRTLLSLLVIAALILSFASCYFISGQDMEDLEGTYKLTSFTYTPKYERKEGYTPTERDYVNGESFLYEDYLVITGESTGYYAHKDASGQTYVKEVKLSYEYDTEDSDEIEYVTFEDALSSSNDIEVNRLGVNGDVLNYTKSAYDYTTLITQVQMRSESVSVRWEKVSDDTDLSYVKEKLGNLKSYDYEGYKRRGIYELTTSKNIETGEYLDSEYLYLFYVIDTYDGASTATLHYAQASDPEQKFTRTVTFSYSSDLTSLTVDGDTWTLESMWGNYYISQSGNMEYHYFLVSNIPTSTALENLIENKMPVD